MITLTFDTNVLRDYIDPCRPSHEAAKGLVELDEQGICEIRVVSRFAADVPDEPLRAKLEALSICQRPRIGTIAQFDLSRWGEDFWANENESAVFDALFSLIFPRADRGGKKHRARLADAGHLLGHLKAARDLFVTRDQPILKRSHALLSDFDIRVMTPADALVWCAKTAHRSPPEE